MRDAVVEYQAVTLLRLQGVHQVLLLGLAVVVLVLRVEVCAPAPKVRVEVYHHRLEAASLPVGVEAAVVVRQEEAAGRVPADAEARVHTRGSPVASRCVWHDAL
eukprot:CAMPEP_0197905772 /NCGR_PEP_ID=MMETSP1439-20131203/61121_1 /TAXON_ID=66791 /ORGANISM="Gonyaulax spinifera, Strain CCMP409" /LENGTH=103 /DNA_ID=CAMNT_0043527073 /DNA_START=205 /DNA_END=516 /DNA_ORIENTATION=-